MNPIRSSSGSYPWLEGESGYCEALQAQIPKNLATHIDNLTKIKDTYEARFEEISSACDNVIEANARHQKTIEDYAARIRALERRHSMASLVHDVVDTIANLVIGIFTLLVNISRAILRALSSFFLVDQHSDYANTS